MFGEGGNLEGTDIQEGKMFTEHVKGGQRHRIRDPTVGGNGIALETGPEMMKEPARGFPW
jgi:hypothetical protein